MIPGAPVSEVGSGASCVYVDTAAVGQARDLVGGNIFRLVCAHNARISAQPPWDWYHAQQRLKGPRYKMNGNNLQQI